MAAALETIAFPIRRAKLRPPAFGDGLVPRPRLTALLDRGLSVPLTLVAAPAGFGKTTLLAEWVANRAVPTCWLTVDTGDRDLRRFVPHVVAALEAIFPAARDPVLGLLQRPHPVPAVEIGASVADELLDLPHDLVLIIDDYHMAASADVESFLAGLLRLPAPLFHLLLATRNDPALPLARMRVQEQVNEIRAAELRFTDAEAQPLLALAGQDNHPSALVAALQAQTEGWIAGLRLVTLALPDVADPARIAKVVAGERHLMGFLVEEVLSKQPIATQDFLLRTAVVERFSAPLADALRDGESPGSRPLLASLVQDSLFLQSAGDEGEWYRYHPLFRGLLLHQLEQRFSRPGIADLHHRASQWFAGQGFLDEAISHRIAAGDMAGAASLVADHIHTALDREDWLALDGWLSLLPEPLIGESPRLLLARAAVSHMSGRLVPLRAILTELEALLARSDGDEASIAALRGQLDALYLAPMLPIEWDPHGALAIARRAVASIPADLRYLCGLATMMLACALQATGQTAEAVSWLTARVERDEDRIDAGSIRALLSLIFVHRQAGNYHACADAARTMLALATRRGLPVSIGWAHWALGWIAYEHDDLELATRHFCAIAADHRRVHLSCAFDAMLGLALCYQARTMAFEADSTLRRLLEMVLDANALEYLPTIRGFEARLALLRRQPERALAWLGTADATIASNSLYESEHGLLTRIKVLLGEGSAESLAQAWRDVEDLRAFAEACHQQPRLIEILALAALVLDARGRSDEALAAMRRSVELAAPGDFCRTYADLGRAVVPLLRRLAAHDAPAPYLARLLTAVAGTASPDDQNVVRALPGPALPHVLEILTVREAEVLAGLSRRLSYREIGDELFISLPTVKSHTANIYNKLGVGNRRQALAKAESLGWSPRA